MAWVFYRILERFLQKGPEVNPKSRENKPARDISIGILELNFQTIDDYNVMPEGWSLVELKDVKRENGLDAVLGPGGLMHFLKYYIDLLLSMGNNFAPFGVLLYERIGVIKYLIDGEVQSEVDLGKCLEELDIDKSLWGSKWPAWKAKANLSRIQHGLGA